MEQKAILQSTAHLKLLTSVISVPGCRCRVSSTSEITGSNPSLKTKISKTCFNYQLNAQFLYSITICMLHYNPRHVSSINMPIFRRTNCIMTASRIVNLCTVQYRE